MKTNLILLALMASSMTAFSQGTVLYRNLNAVRAPILIAPAHPADQVQGQPTAIVANSTAPSTNSSPANAVDYGAGATGASGSGFTAELWAGPNAGSLTAVNGSQVGLQSGALAGYITQISTLPVQQIAPGAGGTFQLRAWNNTAGTVTSWAAVMANPAIQHGLSAPFTVAATGGLGTPPSSPANLDGLTSFNLYSVPEPSLVALGALGLGALLLRRRKA